MPAEVTRTELLDALKEFADDIEGTPRTRDMDEHGPHAPQTYIDTFGGWTEALEAADLEPPRTRIPNDELLEELQRLDEELDHTPTYEDMAQQGEHSPTTYDRRFGNWAEALAAVDLDPDDARVDRISDEQLLDALRDVADELGRPPNKTEMTDRGEFSSQVYETRFGDWNSALEEAGLNPAETMSAIAEADNVSEEELLDELRMVADEVGGTPTHQDVNEHGAYAPIAYVDQFGSWLNAVTDAGLVDPDDDILRNVVDVALEIGYPPSPHEYNGHDTAEHGVTKVCNEFGDWEAALDAAGFDNLDAGGNAASEVELLDNLSRFAIELGETPTQNDMNSDGPHSSNTYNNRFDGWNNALRAIGLEPNRIRRREKTSDEELLNELRRLADKFDHTPRYKDMDRHGTYSTTTYERRFGSWNAAIKEADLKPNA